MSDKLPLVCPEITTINILIVMNVQKSNEHKFSDVYRNVNYIGLLAK